MVSKNGNDVSGEKHDEAAETKIVLSSPTCSRICDEPLRLDDEGAFDGAEVAAYECAEWDDSLPSVGEVKQITVQYPFCCEVSQSFAVASGDGEHCIQARLLRIISTRPHEATVIVEILDVKDRLSFVKKVSAETKSRIANNHGYSWKNPSFLPGTPVITYINNRLFSIADSNTVDGDLGSTVYIYTDDEGYDHIISTWYYDHERDQTFFGDEVIGLHIDCPYLNQIDEIKKRGKKSWSKAYGYL